MKQLPKNCYCSDFSVYPNNWDKAGASIKKDWYIQYYFHDPTFKNNLKYKYGKLCIVKGGINRYKSLAERRKYIPVAIATELEALELGYNPITAKKKNFLAKLLEEQTAAPENKVLEGVSPDTPFTEALYYALKKVKTKDKYKSDIKCTLKYFSKAASELNFDIIPIKDIAGKHISLILEYCPKVKDYWSANLFNRTKDHLGSLYKPLLKFGLAPYNPIRGIEDDNHIQKLREVLTKEEREEINKHLKEKYYTFWRFVNIFFHSGGRITELMSLKKENMDLVNQRYKCVIEKGRQYKEVWRTIKDIALPLWQELFTESKPNQYLFGKNLRPGNNKIRDERVTKKWKKYVKDQLGIKADLYSLKHLNTDETAALLGIQDAAAMNSHTTTKITLEHYAVGEKERQHQRLKQVQNSFA